MKTVTAEHAEHEAACNWCAARLIEEGLSTEDTAAKRWIKIGVGVLLGIRKDDEMGDVEKKRRCKEAYNKSVESPDHPYPSICVVNGRGYCGCRTCPLYMGTL